VFVAAVGRTQLIEQLDAQLVVLAFSLTQWKRPVQKLSTPLSHTLRLVPGVLRRL
jgi:hypothetical protein